MLGRLLRKDKRPKLVTNCIAMLQIKDTARKYSAVLVKCIILNLRMLDSFYDDSFSEDLLICHSRAWNAAAC